VNKLIVMLVTAIWFMPSFVTAEDVMKRMDRTSRQAIQIDPNVLQRLVQYQCPQGWNKTYDITFNKSKWSENSPVLICKPSPSLIKCPVGTFFYIGGNANAKASGEIGCRTPIW